MAVKIYISGNSFVIEHNSITTFYARNANISSSVDNILLHNDRDRILQPTLYSDIQDSGGTQLGATLALTKVALASIVNAA